MELYPGVKISIGPAIENGFYYDFEFPEGVSSPRTSCRRSKSGCASTSRRPSRFVREDVPVAQARERFAAEDQDYKVELIDDLVTGAHASGRATERLAVHQRAVHRPLPRAARAEHRQRSGPSSCSRSPAPTGAGTPSARCSRGSTAPRSSPRQELARAPRAPRAGPGARPPQARARARPVHFSELSPGSAVLEARRHDALERAARAVARREPRARLHRGQDADPLRRRALGASGHWDKYRENMFFTDVEGAADGRSSR